MEEGNKKNLQMLKSLGNIIFNLNEKNINESVESSFLYFSGTFSYSFNLIVCRFVYSYFLIKGNHKICFEYLKKLEMKENEHTNDNQNILIIFIKFLLSYNTKETKYLLNHINDKLLITKIYINHNVADINSNENIKKTKKDESEIRKKYVKEGINPAEIAKIIRNDEVEKLQEISSQTNFDFNQKIEPSPYERRSFINRKNVALIDYAAFFSSVRCFKYLLMNGAKIENTGKYAIAGGNEEIIHLCEQNHSSFKNAYEASIEFHQNEIFHYLYENKIEEMNNLENLGVKCILFNNYEILSFLLENGMKINENIIKESIETGNMFIVQYFLEKSSISIKSINITKFSGNKEIFDFLVTNKYIETNVKFVF